MLRTTRGEDRKRGSRACSGQLNKALAHVPGVEPVTVEIFGGAIVPETLHFPFSHVPAGDLRDWDSIRAWTERLPEALGLGLVAA